MTPPWGARSIGELFLMLTTEAVVAELPEKEKACGTAPDVSDY